MMKAWLLHQLGSLDDVRPGETPEPVAGPGEAVLRVELAGLNPADRYLAERQYPARPTFPHILGRDGVGTVVALGPGAADGGLRIGDRRLILRSEIGVNRPGTFAELVAVPVESLAEVPPHWSPEQAAGAALVYLTAYQALTAWPDLPARAVVLISGASGGVGVACVHLARAMGHVVIGLSRDAAKSETVSAMGANFMADPNDPAWPKTVKAWLNERGRVDLAVDNIGGSLFAQMVETLADRGRLSCVGRLAGPVPDFNTATLFFRRIKIGGVNVGAYTAAESQHAWSAVLTLLEKTAAAPVVDSVWNFDLLKDAFARLAHGPMGKVALRVQPTP